MDQIFTAREQEEQFTCGQDKIKKEIRPTEREEGAGEHSERYEQGQLRYDDKSREK